jgi:EmrB/QacA subfamily drug resistance transporter
MTAGLSSSDQQTHGGARTIPLLVASVFFLQMLDSTIITTSLPVMAADFGVSPVTMSAGITAYLLALAVVIPAAGWIAERFGARQVLIASILGFTAASLACAFAGRFDLFIAARLAQGAAAALMAPVGRILVLQHAPKSGLVRAIATITWPALLAPVIGPLLGGWITETVGWEWNFLINIPLGVTAAVLFLRLVPHEVPMAAAPFDRVGYGLTATAMLLVLGGLELALSAWPVVGPTLAVAGVLVGVLAVRHLRQASAPLFDLGLLRRDTFRLATMTAGSLQRIGINATPFLLPLLFQLGFGLSVAESGFLILLYFLGNLTAKSITTPLLRWTGFRTLAVTTGIACGLSVAVFAFVPAGAPGPLLWALLYLAGAVRSVQFTTLNTLAYADIEAPERAASATLAAMTQQVAMLLGVAIPVVILRVCSVVVGAPTGLFDIQVSFVVMGAICIGSALWFIRLENGAGAEISGHEPRPRELAGPFATSAKNTGQSING